MDTELVLIGCLLILPSQNMICPSSVHRHAVAVYLGPPIKRQFGVHSWASGLAAAFCPRHGVWNRKTLDQFDRLGPYDRSGNCFGGMFGLGQVPEPRPADTAWRMIWNHRTGL